MGLEGTNRLWAAKDSSSSNDSPVLRSLHFRSIVTRTVVDETESAFSLEDQLYARAAIGWKLKNEKGDFRLEYRGYNEDTYRLTSSGNSSSPLA